MAPNKSTWEDRVEDDEFEWEYEENGLTWILLLTAGSGAIVGVVVGLVVGAVIW